MGVAIAGAAAATAAGVAALLGSAVLFTGAVEWAGWRLRLSHGAVGSTLAAVGTALPEASVALAATLLRGPHADPAVGVGAILGAPLLLATLAPVIAGAAALLQRGGRSALRPDRAATAQDLEFFLPAFALAALAGLAEPRLLQQALAGLLILAYGAYARSALARRGKLVPRAGEAPRPLLLAPRRLPPPRAALAGQLALGLGGMLGGAELFVGGVGGLAQALGVGGFVLAVLVAPLATELPETLNSILWLRAGRDTLAVGNITGAMALQGSLIPALGILATPWHLDRGALVTVAAALSAATALYATFRWRGQLSPAQLLAGGLFYAAYLVLLA